MRNNLHDPIPDVLDIYHVFDTIPFVAKLRITYTYRPAEPGGSDTPPIPEEVDIERIDVVAVDILASSGLPFVTFRNEGSSDRGEDEARVEDIRCTWGVLSDAIEDRARDELGEKLDAMCIEDATSTDD